MEDESKEVWVVTIESRRFFDECQHSYLPEMNKVFGVYSTKEKASEEVWNYFWGDNFESFFRGFMEAQKHTTKYKDECMVEIMCRRQEFEHHLDEMWRIYLSGNMKQLFAYKEQVKSIKDVGLEVLRSKSTGKHKITYKK